jgi:TonB family protein
MAQPGNATEDQVKAAYLFNFAKFAEWPNHALPEGPSPLLICVRGADEDFFDALKAAVEGKIVKTHPVMVKRLSAAEELKSCQIVFFRSSEKKHIQTAIESLARTGVLLIGEDESFLRQGGMINLVRDHGTIRFEISPDAIDRSEIHLSASILSLARANPDLSRTSASNFQVEGARPLEHSVPPLYPDLARQLTLRGTAQVQAWVNPDGTVKEVRVVGGHPLLADALAQAVKQWKYQRAPKETVELVKFSFTPQ